ncbi:MAG TPA: M55 family metallopeptidase [Ruminiclostridium sp.]|nr:M55 family metallopeptidase [Ruminiclostridium sp.]
MKIFISADIEGTTGIAHWDETCPGNGLYQHFADQMTREVNAACEAAIAAGAEDILVKDAHDSARNIDPSKLPQMVRIMRGWTRNPFIMMAGLDSSFDGVAFTGYHSASGSNGNPMAHTMSAAYEYISINGEYVSEFVMNAYTASYFGVPVYFLSGDKNLCEEALKLNPNIKTVAVSEGLGNSSTSIHPDLAVARIKSTFTEALKDDRSKYIIKLPGSFKAEIRFREHFYAYRGGFYPGAVQTGPKSVSFESSDYLDVLKFFMFVF